ncbi:GAP family protein [Ruegeria arenilitoris]|uniref:GAP family protein n=1 Tax=Ruegeria arenilitoris TaxID=1173585 RepID=UPI00147A8A1C|nr:GAP family protein [Ruegeria arenilitoris]
MSDIWVVGIPILLVDVVSPVLLAATAFALTGNRPIANSIALILGHSIAYFVMGMLIVYGLAELFSPVVDFVVKGFANPTPINFVIGFLLGLVLLSLAFRVSTSAEMEKQSARSEVRQQKEGVFPSFVMGATLCIVGMPFAVPYFGFINEMFRFNVQSKPVGLLIYNLFYALPFALIPLAYALAGNSIVDKLKALNRFLSTTASWFVPLLFGILGLAFVVDAIKYFLTGSGLV